MSVIIKQMELGPMANYVYLVGDPDTKQCAVVDPGWDVPAILEALRQSELRPSAVFLTHNHPDHTNGIGEFLRKFDVPVYIHKDDAFALSQFKENLNATEGGQIITVGDLQVTFLHTPGHTQGSQCFLLQDRLLTGDTLFIGGCGRVDLPGSDPEKMCESLRRLAALGDATWVFPGHNYSEEKSIALKEERAKNPYIQASLSRSPAEFRRLVGF